MTDTTQERGIPSISTEKRRGGNNKWVFLIGGLITVAIVAGGLFWLSSVIQAQRAARVAQPVEEEAVRAAAPDLKRSDIIAATPPEPRLEATPQAGGASPPPPPPQARNNPQQLTPEEQAALAIKQRRRSGEVLLGNGADASGFPPPPSPPRPTEDDPMMAALQASLAGGQPQQPVRSSLEQALSSSVTSGVSASRLRDPNMMITQGMFLDCTLQTAISSVVPGLTTCVLANNVYSTNGAVLLLERGSRVVGQYQSGQLRQGMNRIFVLWTRVETPSGVVIQLDSPGTDSLGRSGMDGHVNNHFWQRFGSAMLISVVDDVAQYAADRQSNSNSIRFESTGDATQDAASIIVENTVNMPPTLTKNPGELINITVARDLDFGSVYALTPATTQ
jgi:type IV secretion system protein VirB10